MKIVICDDNKEELAKLRSALENIFAQRSTPLELTSFASGKDCYTYLAANSADIVFFDIYLEDSLGVEIALKLRKLGKTFKLIFLTTSNEFANESYEAQASYYLLKPASEEKIMQALERCDAFSSEPYVTLDAGRSSQISINPKKIVAIEVKDKHCFVYTATQTYKCNNSLNKLREQLPGDYFLLIHRSYLINMFYVESLEDGYFLMQNGFKAPIRIRDANAIRNYYMQWSLDNM